MEGPDECIFDPGGPSAGETGRTLCLSGVYELGLSSGDESGIEELVEGGFKEQGTSEEGEEDDGFRPD